MNTTLSLSGVWLVGFLSKSNNLYFLDRICAEMAELASTAREYDKAINFYKEGLTYDETYVPV